MADPPRAVVELFTSQGCSSCPPADALLVDIARQPDVIALSLPVNYWDYLGWKDTLAHVAFTERQKAYAHGRSDRQVFTPQMIVNGKKSCIGSDRAQIEKAIQYTSKGRKTLPVAVNLSEQNGTVTIAVEETPETAQRDAEIWLLPVLKAQTVPIERGENRGKTDHLRQCGARPEPPRRMARRLRPLRGVRSRPPAGAGTPMWCCCRAPMRRSPGSSWAPRRAPASERLPPARAAAVTAG